MVNRLREGSRALLRWLAARRAPPQPGRFALRQKSSLHGFIGVATAPPWREYLLYLPRGMERLARAPLVVWLHGCRQDPEAFAAGTRIARFADERGFVVLLPRQSRLANAERCWNWFDRRTARGQGEAAIVAAQAADVLERFALDEKRVYVAGLSSGGALAAALALHAPGLVRAVAIHSGAPCGVAHDAADAHRVMAEGPKAEALPATRGRVPALILHGRDDRTVAPVNAVYLARQFLAFNGWGQPLFMTRSVLVRQYDAHGNVVAETRSAAGTSEYRQQKFAFDVAGNMRSSTDASGARTSAS